MRKVILFLTTYLFLLSSCNQEKAFIISGKISSADSSIIYLEHNSLSGTTLLDSCIIGKDNKFKVTAKNPENFDFYCLKLNGKRFYLVANENLKKMEISADSFPLCDVTTGDDENKKFAEVQNMVTKTNMQIKDDINFFIQNGGNKDSLNSKIYNNIRIYKDSIKKIIYADTKSPIAYYLAFQKLAYNINVFNLDDKSDLKCYAAIATALKTNYPNSDRTKQMLNMLEDAHNKNLEKKIDNIFEGETANFIDISFNDVSDKKISLSSLIGKYILLDFCSYSQMEMEDFSFLKNMYNKNKSKGFELYQISYDKDKNYWKEKAKDLPWICVRDSAMNSAVTYNVVAIPSNYLFDKKGNIIAKNIAYDRITDFLK